MNNFEKVLDFQKKVLKNKLPNKMVNTITPDFEKRTLMFLQEELDELAVAFKAKDKAEIVDALIDLNYFALGALAQLGVDYNVAFDIVHKANMTKKVGIKKERGIEGDAVKPANFVSPNLDKIVK